ncbi:hypothetical protein RRG08_047084 [Elysia crispata]|uniref:Secreted protein n=1 Tax=Elysia crispata TaxID=231223 RepID=A0AAE1A9B6_9GAST|nr:hypothetical protein RRG08_047084 [Elysia crispata]
MLSSLWLAVLSGRAMSNEPSEDLNCERERMMFPSQASINKILMFGTLRYIAGYTKSGRHGIAKSHERSESGSTGSKSRQRTGKKIKSQTEVKRVMVDQGQKLQLLARKIHAMPCHDISQDQ